MDTLVFVRNTAIWIFVIEIGALFVSLMLGTNGGINAQTTQLTSLTGSIAQQANTTGNAFAGHLFHSAQLQTVNCQWWSIGCSSALNTVENIFIGIGNFIVNLLSFLISVLILIGLSIGLIFFLLVIYIPAIFTNLSSVLGVFSSIFIVGYVIVTVIAAYYIFEVLLQLIGKLLGGVKKP
jgi:hypothetical protein